jgi:hypothetical protein
VHPPQNHVTHMVLQIAPRKAFRAWRGVQNFLLKITFKILPVRQQPHGLRSVIPIPISCHWNKSPRVRPIYWPPKAEGRWKPGYFVLCSSLLIKRSLPVCNVKDIRYMFVHLHTIHLVPFKISDTLCMEHVSINMLFQQFNVFITTRGNSNKRWKWQNQKLSLLNLHICTWKWDGNVTEDFRQLWEF